MPPEQRFIGDCVRAGTKVQRRDLNLDLQDVGWAGTRPETQHFVNFCKGNPHGCPAAKQVTSMSSIAAPSRPNCHWQALPRSGLNATLLTASRCPANVALTIHPWRHPRDRPSCPSPLHSRWQAPLPSGLNDTLTTLYRCPLHISAYASTTQYPTGRLSCPNCRWQGFSRPG